MTNPDSPEESSAPLADNAEAVPAIENNADAVKAVLAYGHIEGPIDRRMVMEAAAFMGNPTNLLSDIVRHATNIGEVIGGYMMQGGDAPADVDEMHSHLLKLLCRHHIGVSEVELSKEPPDVSEAQRALRLALDVAKVLSRPKGYNDGTFLVEVQALQERIDQL